MSFLLMGERDMKLIYSLAFFALPLMALADPGAPGFPGNGTVPEPGTLALLGVGAAVALALKLKRKL